MTEKPQTNAIWDSKARASELQATFFLTDRNLDAYILSVTLICWQLTYFFTEFVSIQDIYKKKKLP